MLRQTGHIVRHHDQVSGLTGAINDKIRQQGLGLEAETQNMARAIPSCLRRGCPQVHRLDWRLAIEIGGFPDDAGFRL